MALLPDAGLLKSWLDQNSSRYAQMAGCFAHLTNGRRKRIGVMTKKEVIFGSAMDFLPAGLFWKCLVALEADGELISAVREQQRVIAAWAPLVGLAAGWKRDTEAGVIRLKDTASEVEKLEQLWQRRLTSALLEAVACEEACAERSRQVEKLRQAVQERGITTLLHFTRLCNLAGILREGLKPRWHLKPSEAAINDPERFDGFLGASSFSIGFPNYKVFWRFREKYKPAQWVVLEFSAEILFAKKCIFSFTNAASNHVRQESKRWRTSCEAFDLMFAEEAKWATPIVRRTDLGLLPCLTTDPQAEVLVPGTLSPDLIVGVWFQNRHALDTWASKHVDVFSRWHQAMLVDEFFFDSRPDVEFWRTRLRC